ncbi:ER membrane protein complex subunit 10-like [Pomacea canaliculata]|uniref:ER membrane protein complex subunit 10-like n=1 Tax=Pomacea canaliculata TaxID=400727 RepID=UPI000D726303|nr:ER membrane protein complex subunit 10-like [Pomacea canaliculata]
MVAPFCSTGLRSLLSIFVVLIVKSHAEEEFEGSRTLLIEHSFDSGPEPVFTRRGTVVIHSLKSNKAQFSQAAPLTHEEREQLAKLAYEDGIYRLRIPLNKGINTDADSYVSTFTRACGLYESGLTDQLTINFDPTGEVLGVSEHAIPGRCTGAIVDASNLTNWKTAVDAIQSVSGPVPDTQTYLEKVKRDEQERAKGQQGDNRSFFGKYWMYIVPVVIMLMIMSTADQQAGAGGGGGGGR